MAAVPEVQKSHASYEEAMKLRDGLHDKLIGADYRRGYVSMDESPGEDHKPLTTHRISYSPIGEKGKRCEIVQTFKDRKGSGETRLIHEQPYKSEAVPG